MKDNLGNTMRLFAMVSIWFDKCSMRFDSRYVSVVKSSLPGVCQTVRYKRIAEDTQMDRMTLWMRNVDSTCHFGDVIILLLTCHP